MRTEPKPEKRLRDPALLARLHLELEGEPCERCELRPGMLLHHKRRRSRGGVEEPRVASPVHVGEPPSEVARQRVDDGGDRPLHDLVADVANQLGQVEGRAPLPPRAAS